MIKLWSKVWSTVAYLTMVSVPLTRQLDKTLMNKNHFIQYHCFLRIGCFFFSVPIFSFSGVLARVRDFPLRRPLFGIFLACAFGWGFTVLGVNIRAISLNCYWRVILSVWAATFVDWNWVFKTFGRGLDGGLTVWYETGWLFDLNVDPWKSVSCIIGLPVSVDARNSSPMKHSH